MAELSGAAFPGWLEDRLAVGGDDPEAVRRIGIEAATALCEALLEFGVPGLHFYTMNRSTATIEITRRLGLLSSQS
jgi:methylenetetrahydrofolate reductase (NADPH)